MSFPADWVLGNRKSMSLHFRWSHFFWTSKLRTSIASSLPNNLLFPFFLLYFYRRFMQMPAFSRLVLTPFHLKHFHTLFLLLCVNLFIVKIFWWFPDYWFCNEVSYVSLRKKLFSLLTIMICNDSTLYGYFLLFTFNKISEIQTKFRISHCLQPFPKLWLQKKKKNKRKKNIYICKW